MFLKNHSYRRKMNEPIYSITDMKHLGWNQSDMVDYMRERNSLWIRSIQEFVSIYSRISIFYVAKYYVPHLNTMCVEVADSYNVIAREYNDDPITALYMCSVSVSFVEQLLSMCNV